MESTRAYFDLVVKKFEISIQGVPYLIPNHTQLKEILIISEQFEYSIGSDQKQACLMKLIEFMIEISTNEKFRFIRNGVNIDDSVKNHTRCKIDYDSQNSYKSSLIFQYPTKLRFVLDDKKSTDYDNVCEIELIYKNFTRFNTVIGNEMEYSANNPDNTAGEKTKEKNNKKRRKETIVQEGERACESSPPEKSNDSEVDKDWDKIFSESGVFKIFTIYKEDEVFKSKNLTLEILQKHYHGKRVLPTNLTLKQMIEFGYRCYPPKKVVKYSPEKRMFLGEWDLCSKDENIEANWFNFDTFHELTFYESEETLNSMLKCTWDEKNYIEEVYNKCVEIRTWNLEYILEDEFDIHILRELLTLEEEEVIESDTEISNKTLLKFFEEYCNRNLPKTYTRRDLVQFIARDGHYPFELVDYDAGTKKFCFTFPFRPRNKEDKANWFDLKDAVEYFKKDPNKYLPFFEKFIETRFESSLIEKLYEQCKKGNFDV